MIVLALPCCPACRLRCSAMRLAVTSACPERSAGASGAAGSNGGSGFFLDAAIVVAVWATIASPIIAASIPIWSPSQPNNWAADCDPPPSGWPSIDAARSRLRDTLPLGRRTGLRCRSLREA
jgi:hypothetical protein